MEISRYQDIKSDRSNVTAFLDTQWEKRINEIGDGVCEIDRFLEKTPIYKDSAEEVQRMAEKVIREINWNLPRMQSYRRAMVQFGAGDLSRKVGNLIHRATNLKQELTKQVRELEKPSNHIENN